MFRDNRNCKWWHGWAGALVLIQGIFGLIMMAQGIWNNDIETLWRGNVLVTILAAVIYADGNFYELKSKFNLEEPE